MNVFFLHYIFWIYVCHLSVKSKRDYEDIDDDKAFNKKKKEEHGN